MPSHGATRSKCKVLARHPWYDRISKGRHGAYYTIYAPGQTLLMVPLAAAADGVHEVTGLTADFTEAVFVRSLDSILAALLLAIFFLLAVEAGYRRRAAILTTIVLWIRLNPMA